MIIPNDFFREKITKMRFFCDSVEYKEVTSIKIGENGWLVHAYGDAEVDETRSRVLLGKEWGVVDFSIIESVELEASVRTINKLWVGYSIINSDDGVQFKVKDITAIKCGKDGYVCHGGEKTEFNVSLMVG